MSATQPKTSRRGGARPNSGPKPHPESRTALLSLRVTPDLKDFWDRASNEEKERLREEMTAVLRTAYIESRII